MNRPQRQVKAPQRLIEQDVPEPAKRISQSRRTLNLDIPKVDLKRDVVQDVIDKPKITKRKTKSGIKQTLHLNLDVSLPVMTKK